MSTPRQTKELITNSAVSVLTGTPELIAMHNAATAFSVFGISLNKCSRFESSPFIIACDMARDE
jgi:hypothetical protein